MGHVAQKGSHLAWEAEESARVGWGVCAASPCSRGRLARQVERYLGAGVDYPEVGTSNRLNGVCEDEAPGGVVPERVGAPDGPAVKGPSPRPGTSGLGVRYGVAALAVGLAVLIQWLLVPVFGVGSNASPFMAFFAAVMVAAWFGGLGPGLLATALSAAISWYFFLSLQFSFAAPNLGQGLRVVVFVLEGGLISLLAGALRTARLRSEVMMRRARENEADLRLGEERLRLSLEATGLGTWDFDPATGAVRADGHAKRMLGIPPEAEMDYETFLREVHPDDEELVGELVRRALDPASGGEYEVQYRTVDPEDGTERWIEARGRASFDRAGGVERLVGTVLDITGRKKAEQELRARAGQQQAVAELGQRALGTTDLQGLLQDAAESAATVLGVEYAAVLELLPGGEELLLRAGVGWEEGMVGREGIDSGRGSQAGYTIRSGEPVIVEDLRAETRFVGPPTLRERGVVSGMSVIVNAEGQPFGVLGAYTKERRTFTEDDVNFLRAAANVLSMAIERERAEDKQRFLAETSVLLSSSLDYRTTLASVARLAVPALADWCAVDVLNGGGSVERLAVEHKEPEKVHLALELQERYPPDPEAPGGVLNVLKTGHPEFYPEITDQIIEAAARDEEHLRILREIGFTSAIIVPMTVRGMTLGAVTLVSAESGRRYGEADLEIAEELARRGALAVDNARLYEEAQKEIAERERAQAELHRSRDELDAILEGVADGVTAQDPTGRLIYANEAAARIVGYPSSRALLEAPPREAVERFEILDEEGRPFALDNLPGRMALRGERAEEVLRFRARATGEERWSSVRAVPVFDGRGEVLMAVNIFRDITERKRTEVALKEIKEAERRRIARDLHDGVLQDLSYTAAALGLIMLGAERTSLEEEMQKAIDAVRRAAQGLRDAVNDLRLEDKQDVPFPELVESLVLRSKMMARGIEMDLEVESGVPSSPLGEIGMELLRVIQEALTNARRHSEASNVLVTLKMDGDYLIAEVSDDGRGFGPETASGVGLSSMRERAAVIGGKLDVMSETGQGTRVRLRVPLPRKG